MDPISVYELIRRAGRDLRNLLDGEGYFSLDSEMVGNVFLMAFAVPFRRRISSVRRDVKEAVDVVNFSLRPSHHIKAKTTIRQASDPRSWGTRTLYVEVKRRKKR